MAGGRVGWPCQVFWGVGKEAGPGVATEEWSRHSGRRGVEPKWAGRWPRRRQCRFRSSVARRRSSRAWLLTKIRG